MRLRCYTIVALGRCRDARSPLPREAEVVTLVAQGIPG